MKPFFRWWLCCKWVPPRLLARWWDTSVLKIYGMTSADLWALCKSSLWQMAPPPFIFPAEPSRAEMVYSGLTHDVWVIKSSPVSHIGRQDSIDFQRTLFLLWGFKYNGDLMNYVMLYYSPKMMMIMILSRAPYAGHSLQNAKPVFSPREVC